MVFNSPYNVFTCLKVLKEALTSHSGPFKLILLYINNKAAKNATFFFPTNANDYSRTGQRCGYLLPIQHIKYSDNCPTSFNANELDGGAICL